MKQRLQKLISQTGLLSRRQAEQWIKVGRVAVNGTVAALGSKADLADRITVDGKPLGFPAQTTLIAFHKPRHVMVTRRDPEGRPTVYDYLPPEFQRLKPVGRLDFESEGLLLLTNDGDLHNRLLHPRYHLEKRYEVVVSPPPTSEQLEALRSGAGAYRSIQLRILRAGKGRSYLEMTLSEGKNRQIRRMCAALGLCVERLTRIAFGEIELGDLPRKEWRMVKDQEMMEISENRSLLKRLRAGSRDARLRKGRFVS